MSKIEDARRCSRCKEQKGRDEFYQGKGYPDGIAHRCKVCERAAVSERHRRNPEPQRERNRRAAAKYRRERPDEFKAKLRERTDWERAGTVTADDLKRLYLRSNGRCHYCGTHVSAKFRKIGPRGFDHVIPRSAGGTHDAENIVVCCVGCNRKKGSKTGVSA